MSSDYLFCLEQAAAARAEADASPLANVKQRFLLAESSWLQMAHRQARADAARDRRAAAQQAGAPMA
jgi:hypothetical protein